MMLRSTVCRMILVQFAGKTRLWRFFKLQFGVWAGHWSINKRIFRFCIRIDLSKDIKKSVNREEVIEDFLFAAYLVCKVLTFLKHRGFIALPITNGFNLSLPAALTARKTISANCSDFLWEQKSIFTLEKLLEINLLLKSTNKD